jgi:hypothetical protein
MTIFARSKGDLATMLSVATGVSFVEADLIYGTPRTTTSEEVTKYNRNTVIALTVVPGSSKAKGTAVVYYDRTDLAPLVDFNLRGTLIDQGVAFGTWLSQLINLINVKFEATELVPHDSVSVDGSTGLQLEAKPDSIGWIGNAMVKIGGYPDISTVFNSDKLLGF